MGSMCNASKFAEGDSKCKISTKLKYNGCKMVVCKPMIDETELTVEYPKARNNHYINFNLYKFSI